MLLKRSTSFDVIFINVFFRWGLIAHNFRWFLFITPFFVTAFLGIGFIWIQEQTTIDPQYVFSPEDANWRYEKAVLSEYWPLDEQHFWPGKSYDYNGYVDVIVAARMTDENLGRPNILLQRYINEVDRVNQYIVHNLTVSVSHRNDTFEVGYMDLCMSYDWKCYLNDHITMLQPKSKWTNFKNKDIVEFAKDIIDSEVKITYPIGWRGTEPIYFGALVGGVHLSDDAGHFNYARAVRLTYNVRDGPLSDVSFRWRKKLAVFLANKNKPASDLLEFGFYHNQSLPEGLQDVANTLTPAFAACTLILFTFCIGCSLVMLSNSETLKIVGVDWVRSKPILGVAALVCPLLAIVSAFGILLWMGVLYNAIVNVSPFIVLCIGIDDAFLMTAAWHRTNPQLSVARRLAETLAEAAVAISITSITDMMTFGIGCFTTLPGVRLFCMYTFWGITFTYIYQITYFTAVMAIAGEMEDRGRHALLGIRALEFEQAADSRSKLLFLAGSVCREKEHEKIRHQGNAESNFCAQNGAKNASICTQSTTVTDDEEVFPDAVVRSNDEGGSDEKIKKTNKNERFFTKAKGCGAQFMRMIESSQHELDQQLESHHGRETLVNQLFRKVYGPFLLTKRTKIYVFGLFLAYFGVACFGVSQIKEGLNPRNLVRSSFYLTNFYELIDETFWQEGLQMQVVINKPPDLFDVAQRARFAELLNAFESTQFTMQHNATMLWLDAYEAHLRNEEQHFHVAWPNSSEEWYARCQEWLLIAGGRRLWELDMVWNNSAHAVGHKRLRAFRFQVGLRNYRTPTDHTNSCRLMRDLANRFRDLNVTTFHEYYPFADQYLELKPALYRNCVLALFCMIFVSFVMIPNWGAAFVIVAAIISIDIGVLGYMALWGVNLESVSMITIIMSIGFSVDLSAHITYGYVKATHAESADERALAALETLGWPVFLGAFSTVVGILVLTLVDAYIVLIFFKTIFLVITFSLLHGIVFLPVMLTVTIGQAGSNATKRKKSAEKCANLNATPNFLEKNSLKTSQCDKRNICEQRAKENADGGENSARKWHKLARFLRPAATYHFSGQRTNATTVLNAEKSDSSDGDMPKNAEKKI